MKALLSIPFEIIGGIFEAIFEEAVKFCPPLLILVFVIIFFMSDGCLSKFVGCLLIPVGIIALFIWIFL